MPGGGYCDNNTSQPNCRLWLANWAELGNKNKKTKLRLVGVNANGIKSKMISFQRMISELNPGVFFLQETKLRKEGHLENEVDLASQYKIYEHLRKAKSGGGLAIGVAKELNSAWLCEGDDRS